MRSDWGPRFWVLFALWGVVLGFAIPLLNRWVAPDSPFAVPDYLVPLLGKYLCYAILALRIDLVWGYAGILSRGHGAFFALGGYCMGMYLMRQIGTRGVYQNPILPDFMVFLHYQELPWFWWGFDHFAYAALMMMAGPGIFAFIFGWLAFRSRVTGVCLSIITQAMTYALWRAFFRHGLWCGGHKRLTDLRSTLASYVPHVGIVLPMEVSAANSLETAIWVSSGGRGTLLVAIIGAVLVNLAKTWLNGAVPEIWLFFLGGLFVASTLLFPRGVVGVMRSLLWPCWMRPETSAAAPLPTALAAGEPAAEKRA